ncbi:MAG: hypothetical protein U1F71_13535 [Verrucomicrobiaceae bacterium]
MKMLLLVLTCVTLYAQATTLGLMTVKMPVYLHGSDGDSMIDIIDVPVINAFALPESLYTSITHSFVPTSVSEGVKPENVNVAAEYGIKASMEEKDDKDIPHWIITVDASAAKRPEGYPFTVEQVTDAVVTCVKMMTPVVPEDERKLTIKVVTKKSAH